MGYRDHIAAKLSALAVAGGTTAMLFAASPVHTAFSATTTGSLSATGAKVAQTLVGGDLTLSGLVPVPGESSVDYSNPRTMKITNTGSVPETLSLTMTGLTTSGKYWTNDALDQLDFEYCMTTTSSGICTPTNGQALLPDGEGSLNVPVPLYVNLSSGKTLYIHVAFGLATDASNAWNGASVTIPYTITAEPGSTTPAPTLTN